MGEQGKNDDGFDFGRLKLVGITGGVWQIPSVEQAPQDALECWEVFEIENGERHLVGRSCRFQEGRATTAIVAFNPVSRTIRTQSGRLYELLGQRGPNGDARYVWGHWCEANSVRECRDVTAEYEQAIELARGAGASG